MGKVLKATGEFIFGIRFRERSKNEWTGLVEFIKNPDEDWNKYWSIYGPNGSGLPEVCGCPEDYTCPIHLGCSHHRKCSNKAECERTECIACDDSKHYLHHDCRCKGHKDHFGTGVPRPGMVSASPKSEVAQVLVTRNLSSQDTGSSGESMSLPRQNTMPSPSIRPPQGIFARSYSTPITTRRNVAQRQEPTARPFNDSSV